MPRPSAFAFRLAASALGVVLAASGAAALADESDVASDVRDPLRLAATVWPPFTDVDARPRFATELVLEALARAGRAARIDLVGNAELTPEVLTSRFDGSVALWRAPEREAVLRYSAPYLENRLVLVGRRGGDVSAERFEALAGRRVAVVEGYAYGRAVDGAEGPTFVRGESLEANLRALLAGEVDYALIDDLVVRQLLEYQGDAVRERLAIGEAPLVRRTLHVAVRDDLPGAEELVGAFDRAIREMLVDGTYHDILKLRWIRMDVDRDGTQELVLRGKAAGAEPPAGAYDALPEPDADGPARAPEADERRVKFFVGGEMYVDWNDVPARFKTGDAGGAGPSGEAVSVFRIRF